MVVLKECQLQCSVCTRTRCMVTLMVAVIMFFLMTYRIPEISLMPIISMGYSSKLLSDSRQVTSFTAQNKSSTDTSWSMNLSILPFKKEEIVSERDAETLRNLANMHKVKDADCRALYNDSSGEMKRAQKLKQNLTLPVDDSEYLNLTVDCSTFLSLRGYILSPLTKEEKDFPLAFSMLVFKEAEMVERLLRAIYRPQNYYCIHVDQKSTDTFYSAISGIAKCFPNVFLTSRRIDVQWGWFSILEPELICMEELWRYPKWKYFINLTGQEFPLKTNYELVRILSVYDGANDIEGTIKRANKDRWRTTPPLGVRAVKGSVHITANRKFIDFILHNNTAKTLLEWVKKDTSVPDETFFATINHNPQLGVRGSYKGEPETGPNKPFLTRYKNWGSSKCTGGIYVRAICILTLGDLPVLGQAKSYFANKFYLSQDRVVIGCLEEKIFNDTRDEYLGVKTFDTSYYANLDFVKNKV